MKERPFLIFTIKRDKFLSTGSNEMRVFVSNHKSYNSSVGTVGIEVKSKSSTCKSDIAEKYVGPRKLYKPFFFQLFDLTFYTIRFPTASFNTAFIVAMGHMGNPSFF